MTAERRPLSKWLYPEKKKLGEDIFPAGRPPFDPFPSVTNLLNAALCPVAAVHDFLRGNEGALLGQYDSRNLGELFHGFIAHLKRLIVDGKLDLSASNPGALEGAIQSIFLDYSSKRGFGPSAAGQVWERSIQPWVNRRLLDGSLGLLRKGDHLFFELWIVNPRMELTLDGGVRHYPVYGRADEIDIERQRIIERTVKPPISGGPPLLKDLQVWLLWKALTTLPKKDLPGSWRSVPFERFELMVETPEVDFVIDKASPDFETQLHAAYSWIHDICSFEQPGVMREVYDNAQCTPQAPHRECSHPFTGCFPRTFPFPSSRPEMKRIFAPWYRLLLWERMWQGDLWWYQTSMLDSQALVEKGLISRGRIVSSTPEKTEIRLEHGVPQIAGGFDRFEVVVFGTMACGLRTDAKLLEVTDNSLVMKFGGEGVSRAGSAVLFQPSSDSSSVFQRQPEFLTSGSQRGLFKVQKMGLIKPERAASVSQVQLLEAIFGPKRVAGRKR